MLDPTLRSSSGLLSMKDFLPSGVSLALGKFIYSNLTEPGKTLPRLVLILPMIWSVAVDQLN